MKRSWRRLLLAMALVVIAASQAAIAPRAVSQEPLRPAPDLSSVLRPLNAWMPERAAETVDDSGDALLALRQRLEALERAERQRADADWNRGQAEVLELAARDDSAASNDDPATALGRRVAELEARLQQRDAVDAKAADAAAKKFTVRPFGRIHIDAATFNQDAANLATVGDAQNGIDIRRARLGVEGEGFGRFFYRFDVDFVTFDSSTMTRPVIFDAYLDMKELPGVGNVRIGHFREPFSLERLSSTHDQPFLERSSVVNALAPFRNLGVMAFDWNECETMTWSYGLFDENTNEFGEDNHDRTGVAATGRLTWLPWYDETCQGAGLLHLGTSYSFRHVGGDSLRQFAATPEVILKHGTTGRTPNFVNTGLLPVGDYHVAGAEFSTVLGSLSFQGEYLFTAGDLSTGPSFFLHGGYVEGAYFWTGEHRNYLRQTGLFGAVTPHSSFVRAATTEGIRTGGGAWESTLRLSVLDLNDQTIAGGQMNDITAGLNWYYTVRSRVMFNYIRSNLDRGGVRSHADILAMRFQYAF